jgi:hypothetical protein
LATGAIIIRFPGFEDDFAGGGGGDLGFGHDREDGGLSGIRKGKNGARGSSARATGWVRKPI